MATIVLICGARAQSMNLLFNRLCRRLWVLLHVLSDALRLPVALRSRRSGFPFLFIFLVLCATGFLVLLLAQCFGLKFVPVTLDIFQPAKKC